MNGLKRCVLLLSLVALVTGAPAARAQFAVIDVAAIVQAIQQVQLAQQQLVQAQAAYAAITGARGMQNLLSGVDRNYLPTDWPALQQFIQGGAVAGVVATNAILTPQQMANLSPTEQAEIQAARNDAAMLQVLTRQALSTTSQRFNSLQQLITAIGGAADQKAVSDLQARINAEQVMLQNENSKLTVLYQTAQAQEWARRQQLREQAISDIGSFRNLPPMGLQ
jgi:type IV secretion system protein VirB5